jgi:sugar-specific transcriptional regulator TrmB
MIVDKDLLKKLRSSFDLNEYEVKIWTALLSKGVATAGELAEISNVPRSRSYDVLESLEKRGFIIVKLGKPIKYIAVSPNDVLHRIKKEVLTNAESQIKYISKIGEEDFFNEVNLLYKNGIEHVDPSTLSGLIQGRKNIYNQIETMIKEAKESIVISTSKTGLRRKLDLFGTILDRLSKKGVNIKIASPEIEGFKTSAELRSFGNFDARFILVDRKKLLFMLNRDCASDMSDIGIWINSPYFVGAMSNMFDSAWNQK